MVTVPDASYYADPRAWRIAGDASAATVSMNSSKDPRLLCRLPLSRGAFHLSPSGLLAGFRLRLALPAGSAAHRDRRPAVLLWDSADLHVDGPPNDLAGRARLRLGRREIFPTVSGRCVQVPARQPYLKIVLTTVFPAVLLRWPAEASRRLRPVTLTLFSEIRPAAARAQR